MASDSLQAEFETLLATSVRSAQRVAPGQLRLELAPDPGVAAQVASLAEREIACCSFFSFTISLTTKQLQVDVFVPADRIGVLDALAQQATAATA